MLRKNRFSVQNVFNRTLKFADNLIREATDNRCYVVKCECAEHGANSAIYEAEEV